MPHLRLIILMCLVAWPQSTLDASGQPTRRLREQWNGSWVVSESFNKMLGFDAHSRLDAAIDHPTAFRLTFREDFDDQEASASLRRMKSFLTRRLRHQIVGYGAWETTFENDPGIETRCVFTEHNGSTYVWVGAPFIGIYGGRISLIRGVDTSHDVMVIDFNPTMALRTNSERTPDTVGYRRVMPTTNDAGPLLEEAVGES